MGADAREKPSRKTQLLRIYFHFLFISFYLYPSFSDQLFNVKPIVHHMC